VKSTLRQVAGNIPLMVLALILAVLAWIVAAEEEDPITERRFPQSIPVASSELPEGMVIIGNFNGRVQVTVRAPQSVWTSLAVEDFVATVVLLGLDAGVHQVPVQVTLNEERSRVVSIAPEYVTLELEQEMEAVVPVRVQVEGKPTLGYLRRTPLIVPPETTVRGPRTYVRQVIEAYAEVSVEKANADIEGEFQLRPQDVAGQLIPHVTLVPDAVSVRIPVELSGRYRPLVVKVTLGGGEITPGYRITYISVDPPSVTVFGAPDVISALPGFIETEPIDVTGAQSDIVVQPALVVPPNVAVVMSEQPMVTVAIEPIESSQTVVITPELQGLQPGYTATVSPETVQVILDGPLPLLDELKPKDVRVVLDLFDLPRGAHQIEPQIVVPEGLTAQSILPATVQVETFVEGSRTVVITPELQTLEPGFTATVYPESVAFVLGGPLPLVEAVADGDVRVVLDVTGLSQGAHHVRPEVIVPEGLRVQSAMTATVRVEIFAGSVVTPTEEQGP
jgi:YbbR domain-containing protein